MGASPLAILGVPPEEQTSERWAAITDEEWEVVRAWWRDHPGVLLDDEDGG